jgi:hypothetical protein
VLVVAVIVVIAVSALAVYAMRNKVKLKLAAKVLWAPFSIEVESQARGQDDKLPPDEQCQR